MEVYRRHFKVTEGPVIDVILEATKINAKANEEYAKIIEEVGADDRYYAIGGKLVGFTFKETPDRYVWKTRARGGWWPKKNIKAGKELISRIEAIETKNPEDSLKKVGLRGDKSPRILGKGKMYFCTLLYLPDEPPTAYISVPWFDCDPKELEQYRKDNSRFTLSYESLFWEPTPEMIEIKEWEMMKHLDEWNAKVKASHPEPDDSGKEISNL